MDSRSQKTGSLKIWAAITLGLPLRVGLIFRDSDFLFLIQPILPLSRTDSE